MIISDDPTPIRPKAAKAIAIPSLLSGIPILKPSLISAHDISQPGIYCRYMTLKSVTVVKRKTKKVEKD